MERLRPDPHLSEIERRVANTVHFGVIEEADYERARVRVKIGPLTTGWVPWTTSRAGKDKTWHPPEVGEQVIMACPQGDLRKACVIGTVNSDPNPAPGDRATLCVTTYEDGTTITYDREAHSYAMDVNDAGSVLLKVGASTIEIADDAILLTSNGSTIRLDADGVDVAGAEIHLNK